MKALVYASRARWPFSASELDSLAAARSHNAEVEVTGMLIYADQCFLGRIEGDDRAVEEVFGRIVADDRHTDIRVLTRHPIMQRLFPDWSMGFDAPDMKTLDAWLEGYSGRRVPRPVPRLFLFERDAGEALLSVYAPA